MYQIRFIILLLFIVFSSFSLFKKKSRDYEDIANEISIKVAKKLMARHKMDWIGEGGGMMGSVYMIGLSFQIHHSMDRNEARIRLVDCVEELLHAINTNQEIRPFLRDYPFTTKNIEVAIFIDQENGKQTFDPDFRVISISECDEIMYATVDQPNAMKYKNKYYEPYTDALAIVKKNKASLSSN